MIVKFGYWAGWHLGQPIAKKIGGAIAIGAGAVVGEVVARKVIPKTMKKIEGGIEKVEKVAQTGMVIVQHVVIPAVKAKAKAMWPLGKNQATEEVAATPSPTPVIVVPQKRVANPPAPKKVAINIMEMEVFPPHNVAPGISIVDLE